MSFWTFDTIVRVMGGQWIAKPGTPREPHGAAIDSRAVRAGQVFFALGGERTDGHRYAANAAASGASLVVIEDPARVPPGDLERIAVTAGIVRVRSCPDALLTLGAAVRRAMPGTRVVSIGGSNGKTTTTRLVAAALGKTLRGTHSPKSFNNALGVPLTLLNARPGDDFVICEVGTNAPGEIDSLARVVTPDIAVITSLGREHLEGLKDLAGVANEECAVLPHVATGGTAIVGIDAPELEAAARAIAARRPDLTLVTFGVHPSAELRVTDVACGLDGIRVTVNRRDTFRVPLLGRHNALNVAAAVGVATRFGLDAVTIAAGLERVVGPEMRLQRQDAGGVLVINDAYNANPESMRAAISTFADILGAEASAPGAFRGRRVAVLGDMLELGPAEADLHAEVGEAAARTGVFDEIHFVGPRSAHGAEAAERVFGGLAGTSPAARACRVVRWADSSPASCAGIAGELRPGDAVLLKGSRGMGLEGVVAALSRPLSVETASDVSRGSHAGNTLPRS